MRLPLVFLPCAALSAKTVKGDTSVKDLLSSESDRSLGGQAYTKNPIKGSPGPYRVPLPKYAAPDKVFLNLWPYLNTLDSSTCTGTFIEVEFQVRPPTTTDPFNRIVYKYQGITNVPGVSQADCPYVWLGGCCAREEEVGFLDAEIDNPLGFKVPVGAITFAPDGYSFRVQASIPVYAIYLIFQRLPDATLDIDITVGCTAGVLVATNGIFTCNTKPPEGGDYLAVFDDATMEGHMTGDNTTIRLTFGSCLPVLFRV